MVSQNHLIQKKRNIGYQQSLSLRTSENHESFRERMNKSHLYHYLLSADLVFSIYVFVVRPPKDKISLDIWRVVV